jgi:5-(carboxyamino)imidazole ribonucleotide mutase
MARSKPVVGLIMGSQSDWTTMRHAAVTLEALACK